MEQYITSLGDVHFTVDSLCSDLSKKGETVGRTTVYRCLEKLKNEGKIRKYTQGAGQSACYQYITDGHCNEHFHLKCEKCGSLIHLECSDMAAISEHIKSHHGFTIDYLNTVFYGICERCSTK